MRSKTILIIALFSFELVPAAARQSRAQPHTPTHLMRAAIDWIKGQRDNVTTTRHLASFHVENKGIPEHHFTLTSMTNGTPLINVRSTNAYYYIIFRPDASPENLQGTPLASLLSYVKSALENNPTSTTEIPVSDHEYFTCEQEKGIIRCIFRRY